MGNSGVEFKSHSKEAKRKIQASIEKALESGSLLIEGQIKANITSSGYVDTGELRDSFSHQLKGLGSDSQSKIGTPLKRAIYPEYGTGEFAENGAGRKGFWIYVDGGSSTKKGHGKSYTLAEAKRLKAYLIKKKNLNPDSIHITNGQKPLKFMRKAFRTKKGEIKEIFKNELREGLR